MTVGSPRCASESRAAIRTIQLLSEAAASNASRVFGSVLDQHFRCCSPDWRFVVFAELFECSVAYSGKRYEANPLLEPELRHLFRIMQHLLLVIQKSAAALSFTGQNRVVHAISAIVPKLNHGARTGQDHGYFLLIPQNYLFQLWRCRLGIHLA